jgi:hypothetical protein
VRSNTATTGRVRLVIVLSVAAAVTIVLGATLVAASVIRRLLTGHQLANMTRLGLDVVAVGVAFGLVVLVAFVIARIGTTGRSGRPAGTADHRQGAARPQTAASARGPGKSSGHSQDRLQAGAPTAGPC